jgi:hypothetical protein
MDSITAMQAFASMSPQTAHELMLPQQTAAAAGMIYSTFTGYALIIVVIAALFWISSLTKERKSYKYRKIITDMYVAGSVRKLAKEDGVSIEEEFETFKKFDKKSKRSESLLDLDRAIEEDLKDRQEEKNNRAIEKLSADSKSSDDYVKLKK